MVCEVIKWVEGWKSIKKGISKLKRIVEGLPETPFNAEEYMMLYTTVYNMCTQNPPHDFSQQLYEKYKKTIEKYTTSEVLPSLGEKHDEFIVHEFVKSWARHKVMIRWLSCVFRYLERCFIPRRSLPGPEEVGLNYFRAKTRVAAIRLIDKERDGEGIDRRLLKNVIDINIKIGKEGMDAYKEDIEAHFLKSTGEYYSRKATSWLVDYTYMDYKVKAEAVLRRERDRVSDYFHSSSEQKLVEEVEHKLFEPLAYAFKQKVSVEVKALVQQAEDAATKI